MSVVQSSTAGLHEAVQLERGRSSEVQERSDALEQAHAALVREEGERARARRLEVVRRVVGRMAHAELTHFFDAWSQP